jgi:hypothetical protein
MDIHQFPAKIAETNGGPIVLIGNGFGFIE